MGYWIKNTEQQFQITGKYKKFSIQQAVSYKYQAKYNTQY